MCIPMYIPPLDSLPGGASRAKWAKVLQVHETTLYRAERNGRLKAQRTAAGTVIYTKEAILEYLGFARV